MKQVIMKDVVNILVARDMESNELYRSSIYNENGKGVENSRYIQQWDARYNRIVLVAEKYGIKYSKIQRGNLWKAVFLIDSNDEIYVFFKSKNLNTIIKKAKTSHYFFLLNLFNDHLDSLEPIEDQLKLDFDAIEIDKDSLIIQAKEVVKLMEGTPKKVHVIAFDDKFHNFAEKLNFNSKQELVYKEDLSYLIDSDYKFDLDADNVDPLRKVTKKQIGLVKKQIAQLRK